jgi:hypothetical protein
MALPEILQWISIGRKRGTLNVEHDAVEKRIVFDTGRITSSSSNDPRESFGQFLVRERAATEEQIFSAEAAREKSPLLLGQMLVQHGVLSDDRVREILKLKAEECVYDLFLWTEGEFEFVEDEIPDHGQLKADMDTMAVTLEGVRRLDEWERMRKFFPTQNVRFKVIDPSGADATEAHVLDLVARGKNLSELGLELRRSDFDTATLMFDLLGRGSVAVASTGEATRTTSTVRMIRERLEQAQKHLGAGEYDEALQAFEDVLAFDRLNQNAKRGLVQVFEARTRERLLKSVDTTKTPHLIVTMAELTKEKFDPQEGFVLSRVNGEWDVASILKLCPMGEDDALSIFARLIQRGVIELR